jgi:hypothetical protein
MQPWIESHLQWMWIIFPLYFTALWVLVGFIISYIGGWWTLRTRYRARAPFSGQLIRGQSGQMRWLAGYSTCLNVGANEEGLFLSTMVLFRAGHPPLLIPWDEVTVRRGKFLLVVDVVKFRLDREFSIPLWIRASLASKLRTSAGRSWPVEELA